MEIAIVGGGIGGLVLGSALRQRGMVAEIFEQSSELTEIGAAVALSANATRELERLGLLDGIAAASTEPTELIWRDGADEVDAEFLGPASPLDIPFGLPRSQ